MGVGIFDFWVKLPMDVMGVLVEPDLVGLVA